jgi:carboxylesterase type B
MNPKNKGLFQRIITQSGSVLAQWAQQYNLAEMFEEFVLEVKFDMKRFDVSNQKTLQIWLQSVLAQ